MLTEIYVIKLIYRINTQRDDFVQNFHVVFSSTKVSETALSVVNGAHITCSAAILMIEMLTNNKYGTLVVSKFKVIRFNRNNTHTDRDILLPLIPQDQIDVSAHEFEQGILHVTCIVKIVSYDISLSAFLYSFIDYLRSLSVGQFTVCWL